MRRHVGLAAMCLAVSLLGEAGCFGMYSETSASNCCVSIAGHKFGFVDYVGYFSELVARPAHPSPR